MKGYRPTVAEIHIDRLKENSKVLQGLSAPNSFFCPMVKAEGYGHGAVEMSKALEEIGVLNLGVALIEEGVKLRENNIHNSEILVFGSFFSEGAAACKKFNLTPVVTSWEEMSHLESVLGDNENISVHIKFDTGMNRLGFDFSQSENLSTYLKNQRKIKLKGLCTHLSDGEDAHLEEGRTYHQLEKFRHAVTTMSCDNIAIHALNSAGLIGLHCGRSKTWLKEFPLGVRPGIAIYGAKPKLKTPEKKVLSLWNKIKLSPVMSLNTQIVALKHVRPGERISYGGTWTAPQASLIGVLPIGYEDGLHRSLSNRGCLYFRGEPVPIRGTVCMDYTMIDLTQFIGKKEPSVAETVEIFGTLQEVGSLAEAAETISYELLTSVSSRVPRMVMGG